MDQRNRCKCVRGVQCSKPHPTSTDLKFNMIPRVTTNTLPQKIDKQREECYIYNLLAFWGSQEGTLSLTR